MQMNKLFIYTFVSIFATGLLLLLYMLYYEPYTIEITRYRLPNADLKGLKAVFATDFHIGTTEMEQKRLLNIIALINKEKADLIFLGGDYIKGHKKNSSLPPEIIAEHLKNLHSEYGTYAVLGNHDSYYGKEIVKSALINAGIHVFNNSSLKLNINNRFIYLSGVNDYYTDNYDISKAVLHTQKPLILLSHSPDIFPKVPNDILVLAGHTHGGQISFPFIGPLLVPSDYGRRYKYGLITSGSKQMIVSKGLGTSLLPLRLNCKPEIVVLEFE